MIELLRPIHHPQPYDDEAPIGYLIRVCEANRFNNIRWLYADSDERCSFYPKDMLQRLLDSPWTGFGRIRAVVEPYCSLKKNDLNYAVLRFCPECLAEAPYYRMSWQLRTAAACVKHKVWLIDSCPDCGQDLVLRYRVTVGSCQCGKNLRSVETTEVPESVIRYQQFLDGASQYISHDQYWLANALNAPELSLEYRVQLAFKIVQWQPIEGNLFDISGSFGGFTDMETAIPYVLSAANAFFTGRKAFSEFLDQLQHHVCQDQSGGEQLFKRFYRSFYRSLGKYVGPLNEALSDYLSENWHYALSRKNSLFSKSIIDVHPWIPLQVASKRFEIGKRSLQRAIDAGEIDSCERHYEKSGRTFTLVYVPQVIKHVSSAACVFRRR